MDFSRSKTLGKLRSAKQVLSDLQDPNFRSQLIRACEEMDPDTLTVMLTQTGRKVAEETSGQKPTH